MRVEEIVKVIPFRYTVSEHLEGNEYSVFDREECGKMLSKRFVSDKEFTEEVLKIFGKWEVIAVTPEGDSIDILCIKK